jgi:NADPH:quinone reductase-like Zn-dependent oxidoreductase
VEAVGKNVTDLQPGDEVFGSSWGDSLAAPGTFAEFTVAPASRLIKNPAGLTFEEAAASVMSGLTALLAMRDVGKVGPGTRVLINGASGGVGTFAVQVAKALGRKSPACAAPGASSWSGPSARITSSTTRRRTSPAESGATTSSSTTS